MLAGSKGCCCSSDLEITSMPEVTKMPLSTRICKSGLSPSSVALSPTIYAILASAIASIGGILFGYDIGIISGALLLLRKEFNLSSFQQEIVVSSMLIGSLCGSFFGGTVVDSFGRKNAIILSGILFIAGALILSFSVSFLMLLTGRFVLGIAVSVSVTAECTYISEISPPNRRGMLISLNEVGITFGFLIAYLLNYLLISKPHGWQYMFAAAIVPAFLQIVGIVLMPPSPHYLLIKGKIKEAEQVLKLIRKANTVEDEISAIQLALNEEKNKKYADLLSSANNMRGRLLLGMILVFLQQFSGHANVLYYAPTVFQLFGYCSDSSATLVTIGLGVIKVISTTFTLLTVDKFGRRCLLLIGCFLMALSIMTLGLTAIIKTDIVKCSESHGSFVNETLSSNDSLDQSMLEFLPGKKEASADGKHAFKLDGHDSSESLHNLYQSTSVSTYRRLSTNYGSKINNNEPTKDKFFVVKIISVISLMTFVCAYGISYGPVTWLILSEIFPTALRGRAISIATCINWGSNIIVSLTFLNLLNVIGIGTAFIMYGCLSIVAFFFILFCIPETKKRSLEEINSQLSKGFVQIHFLPCGSPGCPCCYTKELRDETAHN